MKSKEREEKWREEKKEIEILKNREKEKNYKISLWRKCKKENKNEIKGEKR